MWDMILVAICLLLFFAVNLYNVLRYHSGPSRSSQPEVPWPNGFIMGLVAIGTGTFFLESLLYLFLGMFNGPFSMLALFDVPPLNFVLVRPAGALLMGAGYAVFIWSVLARGRYASSWTMSAKHRLVDWGPYRYVRHPSYLGYVLMFIGFFFMWHNLLALVPLVGIPGYVMATNQEEEMLMKRFGQQYAEYRRRVGRFVPRMQLRKS
jgi:protein-S-isoprenylcysteine O-methyltransferase Ste14